MKEIARKCIEVILKNEGGFQKNHNDAGNWVGGYKTGKLVGTKYGIAAKFFPNEDIKNLTIERATDIYYNNYWKRMRLDNLFSHEAVLQIFDFGVNAGTKRSIRLAQKVSGVKQDGICGNLTTLAINYYNGDFVLDFKEARRDYYKWLVEKKPVYSVFLNGWLNRVDKTHF